MKRCPSSSTACGLLSTAGAGLHRGWRPIALLVAVCRVEPQFRGQQLRDWLLAHDRPYFALAVGKTTLDVASRALLHGGAGLAYGLGVLTAI
eukprot:4739907-Pyramimonas_sp.AAC.2